MKTPSLSPKTRAGRTFRQSVSALLACGAAAAGLWHSSARATPYYWDTNGATPGSGATSTGTLGTSAFLSTDSTGSTAPQSTVLAPTANDTVDFGAISSTTTDTTSGSTASTVSINGTQTVLGLSLTIAANSTSSTDALTLGDNNTEEIDIGSSGITSQRYTTGTGSGLVDNGYFIINANVGLTATQTWTFNSVASQAGTINGNIFTAAGVTAATNLTINASTGRTVTINGSVNNNGTFNESQTSGNAFVTVNGVIGTNVTGILVSNNTVAANFLTLSSSSATITNAYTGTTSITSGTLILNDTSGTGAATATGSLTGTSVINVAGANSVLAGNNGVSSGLLTVTSGGQITPGTTAGQTFQHVGTLHLGTSGGVTLTTATLNYDLATTAMGASDKIFLGTGTTTATGALSLGTLTFNFEAAGSATGTAIATGTAYTLITAASTTGFNTANITTNFLGGLAGQGYSAAYTDDGSNLQVTFSMTPVPEPSTWAGASLAVVVGLWSQRRRLAGSCAAFLR